MKIEECNTVEEVESLRCIKCSDTGHWGWCDAPHIKCIYRDRIKEILGKDDYKYTAEEHISMILDK